VTTIFPVYDWVREILGDESGVELKLLLTQGVDLHSYQPTVEDMVQISACDVFVYVGGESDEWARDALAEAVNKEMIVINLLEALGDAVKEEEIVEGMEAEHGHDHDGDDDHEEDHDHDHEEEIEYDEHVWLSLRNARTLCAVIAEALGQLDPANAADYAENAAAYDERLAALDAAYADMAAAAPVHTVLFGDRFPFRYLTDDYDLDYYAAFAGCSAETEASFETVIFLAGKVDELGLGSVMTIEGTDHRIAETIVANTQAKDAEILAMDSMQSVTAASVADGATYLGIMEENLAVLAAALQ